MASAGFCPQCGAQRVGSLRYCGSCRFDFEAGVAGNMLPGSEPASRPRAATSVSADVRPPVATGVARRWTPANLALIGAGVAMIVAPFLPFISATAAFVGSISRSGVEMIGPEVFILVVVGVLIAATGFQRANGTPIGRGLPLIASLAANGLTAWYFIQVNDRVQSAASDYAIASIGTGLWLAVAGSVVAFLVTLLASPPAKAR
jgi:hypothetical protein